MSFWIWIIIIAVILFGILPFPVLFYILYVVLLVRTSPKKWARECTIPDDKEYKRMFDIGIAWDQQYGSCKQPVEVTSDGFRLVGEYYDFGGDTSVIIIAGRMESLLYSYYFAEPYRRLGYNILVIDNRAHGLSEGKYLSLGFKEYRDILKWGELLHDRFGQKSVVIHGICVGCSVGLFALCAPECPSYFKGMVAEGMYSSFHDSFVNHLIDMHHRVQPATFFVMLYIRMFTGADVVHDGPLNRIDRLQKPILFIHSREDIFSLPSEVQQVYDRCQCEKKLVWFDKGAHSRVRINAQEKYDETVIDFFRELDI